MVMQLLKFNLVDKKTLFSLTNLKLIFMNIEDQLIEQFQVEELEKRYEFKWIDEVKVGADYEGFGASVTFET